MTDPQHRALADRSALVAVVGATDTPGKYGGIIYRDLRSRGHRVVAVNPNRATVAGDPCHPDLGSLPDRPDIVNVVVPPGRALRVVDDWAALGGTSIWFQPGSYDRQVLARAQESGMSVIDGDCIMVISRRLAS